MATGGGRHPQFARPFALDFPQWQALQFEEMEREARNDWYRENAPWAAPAAVPVPDELRQTLDRIVREAMCDPLSDDEPAFIVLLELDPMHGIESGPSFLPRREDFRRSTSCLEHDVTIPKHEWRVSSETGYSEDPELIGFDPKLGPHTQVLEASTQMSGMDDSVKRQQREGIAWGMFEGAKHVETSKQPLVGEHQPCKGCADKAKLMGRVLDAHKREIDSLRTLLVGALADIETLKARRSIPLLPYNLPQ